MRESGILFPIFSVPSKFGIGCFSKEAYEFVDFLEGAAQGFWQILPVGPTGYGNSPYQPFSAFAGNAYFISPEKLIEEGLLTWDECNAMDFGKDETKVDYGAMYEHRDELLKKAYERFVEAGKSGKSAADAGEAGGSGNGDSGAAGGSDAGAAGGADESASDKAKGGSVEDQKAFKAFIKKEADWLEDYALFTALKKKFGGASWLTWDDDIRHRKASAIDKAKKELADDIDFVYFKQYEFDKQWRALRRYANKKNVKIIGDLPFYVSLDSADCWAHPEVFQMDKNSEPKVVAGCAPDAFSRTGQLWGNPIYDWKALEKDDFDWWVRRIKRNYEFYDVIRIDHFHGFCEYYAVPYGDETAENGKLCKGPGMALFNALKKHVSELSEDGALQPGAGSSKSADAAKGSSGADAAKGSSGAKDADAALSPEEAIGKRLSFRIIAEDLGNNTPENEALLKESGFPGMKVLQYGFTSWDSYYVNHRHVNNCVVYTGTHDNTPTRAWVEEISDGERDFCRRYINSMNSDYGGLVWDIIREAYRSVADLCIIPLQDYLCLGRETRLNSPGTSEGNWEWRLRPNFLSEDLKRSIRGLTEVYSRVPKE